MQKGEFPPQFNDHLFVDLFGADGKKTGGHVFRIKPNKEVLEEMKGHTNQYGKIWSKP
ncbi:MAG: hypothetical protein ACOC5S_03450 [Acidobacteriota bacterium]